MKGELKKKHSNLRPDEFWPLIIFLRIAFIFAILIVGAFAQEDEKVEIEGAQFGMMNPMMMSQMNPMMGMGGMQMGGMQMGGAQGYQTNYSENDNLSNFSI